MEFYQWLFRRNGFEISDIGYFVYCNGIKDRGSFDARLDFRIKVIPYEGSDKWVDDTIIEIHQTLEGAEIPEAAEDCEYCKYVDEAAGA